MHFSAFIPHSAFLPRLQAPRQTHMPRKLSVRTATRCVAAPREMAEYAGAAAFDDVVMRTYGRYAVAMSHGRGAVLWDTDGREYIDCVAGIATCTLGHADARVSAAVVAQLDKIVHVSNLYYIPEQGALAAWLVKNSPADKVFFCNSGGEANEAAIKLARKVWHTKRGSTAEDHGVPVVISARQSFHGRTLATITATGQPKYHKGFWPMVEGFEYVTYNDVADLRAVVEKVGRENVAGIMLEALQGEGGINEGAPEFFAAAREICDETGALLICDEVQVGVGRTGKLWGFENVGVEPDVFTIAKGLGGGVPIGAMLCKDSCNAFGPGDHASTFGGNPLASAAGLAVATALVEDGVLDNCAARGAQLGAGLLAIKAKYPALVSDVRGWGLIRGIELSGVAAGDVVKAAMSNGLLLVPAGPHVVRFVPPLVVTEKQIEAALGTFEQALSAVAAGSA